MTVEECCRKISKDINEDYDLIYNIVMYHFKFTIDVMKDPEDYHDILFNKLFRFELKNRFKDNKTKDYSPK